MVVSLLKKLLRGVAVFLIVTFVTFSLMYGNGPGIARAVLGLHATAEDVQREVVRLGLDQPLIVQYLDWLRGVVTGNLGHSFFTGQAVTNALAVRLPVTLSVVLITLALTVIISVLLGVGAAVYGGWIDRVVQFVAVLGSAIPSYIIAIVLIFALALSVRLFPATGYVSPDQSFSGWAASITLPVIALLIGSVAGAASQFRSAVADVLGRDYVRTLRARGISERAVIFLHVLRNSAGSGLIVLSLQTIYLIGGAVVIELVFALPGMGELTNTSAQQGDVPLVMGAVLAIIVIVLVVNFLTDLAGAALNPKARKA